VAIDTNVLIYAEGANEGTMRIEANRWLERVPRADMVIPLQVLGEFYSVLTRRSGFAPMKARAAVSSWSDQVFLQVTSLEVALAAIDLSSAHQLNFWDAVVVAAAAEANCQLLLSEDMHNGFVWRGVTVVNPFARELHPLLGSLLD
jgi:predicted nucleic acid-binding protein